MEGGNYWGYGYKTQHSYPGSLPYFVFHILWDCQLSHQCVYLSFSWSYPGVLLCWDGGSFTMPHFFYISISRFCILILFFSLTDMLSVSTDILIKFSLVFLFGLMAYLVLVVIQCQILLILIPYMVFKGIICW